MNFYDGKEVEWKPGDKTPQEQLDKWQSPLEEREFYAMRDLDNAIARIDELFSKREGCKYLRKDLDQVEKHRDRLTEILESFHLLEVAKWI